MTKCEYFSRLESGRIMRYQKVSDHVFIVIAVYDLYIRRENNHSVNGDVSSPENTDVSRIIPTVYLLINKD